jgi:hypothetical protein
MKFESPKRYQVTSVNGGFAIADAQGDRYFRGATALKGPKLYIVSGAEGIPLYIGATVQRMRTRLRQGWSATGASGYYGYAWRSATEILNLDIFCLLDCPTERWKRELETVEAEVAFLVREAGQWPVGQTEIHFFPSYDWHREVAREIASNYPGLGEGRRTPASTGRPAAPLDMRAAGPS